MAKKLVSKKARQNRKIKLSIRALSNQSSKSRQKVRESSDKKKGR